MTILFFFITCLSFLIFYKSLTLQLLPPWAYEMRLVGIKLWRTLSFTQLASYIKINFYFLARMTKSSSRTISSDPKFELLDSEIQEDMMSLLDLPDLALECILEKLPPDGLTRVSSVCTSLRTTCMSNHLWEKHMKQKWGNVIGPAAYREWQWHVATRNEFGFLDQGNERGFFGFLQKTWPWPLLFSRGKNTGINSTKKKNSTRSCYSAPADSVMAWYMALETGKFWFPAQVYNRENGHVGFMLSCYDAELCYDSRTDTFQARYPPHGRRPVAIENGVTWDRLRAAPIDNSPHDLHISECLNELHPGDHIEIQWRRNKEFPYGWWYGVVGHLELCDGNQNYCRCFESDMVALNFNQYTPGSRWRQTTVSRKHHREEGNGADGFYGGIRKLKTSNEISTWKRLWPVDVLE
ncbi:hypothetical protein DCAR_0102141 [Daucus carota subsp. sativus]|uniref:F-box domain-containing protein n=1 Tax=Daucus carota subsp. sativus TaxID=79200 RepID=A0A166GWU4_DAUCS|nr:PREDICTED: F-box protein At2g32560-like [Daucus carota subsp. sativus]WOG82968.1 hypothetical protein DCAR_0102141 [Daucus carota subsp. sativus]